MDKKALRFTCRFSLPPNSLGYCGRNSAPEKFKSCVIEGKCSGVEPELKKFIVLHPYLNTISKLLMTPKFSYKVSEAYWLGNNELKKIKPEDYGVLLKNFVKQGVPAWLVGELEKNPPKEFIPTHLFQVLHVGVGRASGSVPYNIKTINNCMVRWGKVIEISDGKVKVDLKSLKKNGKKYTLVKKIEKASIVPGFLRGLKKGSVVAVHWGQAIKILNADEVRKITYWTKKVLSSL